jgi:cytochrome c oxidase subunit III
MAGSYYVPEKSAFPIFTAFGMWLFVFGLASLFNDMTANKPTTLSTVLTIAGFLALITVLTKWFAAVIHENHSGLTSHQLYHSYALAMKWFIFSEVMFFAAFFGALYYVRSFVVPWLGGEGDKGVTNQLWQGFQASWPVMSNPDNATFVAPHESMTAEGGVFGFKWISAKYLPFINTVLLVSSSVTVHFAHLALKKNNRGQLIFLLALTVLLGFVFVYYQGVEYHHAYKEMGLTLNSGIYGTTFFMLTGFHGFHVTMGATILLVTLIRAIKGHFTPENHFGFEMASWYWHFVDVVWIFLFIFVYLF